MGRHREYNTVRLRRGVERYFKTITREKAVTEMVPTGQNDKYGHPILRPKKVRNALGEEVRDVEYLVPPSVSGLCAFLGIHKSTWSRYEADDALGEITEEAKDRIRAWNERELVTRSGKDVKGIIFNLQANYGYTERREVELGEKAAKAMTAQAIPASERAELLREIAREFGDDGAEG